MDINGTPKHAQLLVVDDDEAIRDALREILEDDYGVTCVDNGFKALEEVQNEVYDLVFLDVIMPEMDGLETLKRIKAFDQNLDVIMISAVDRAQEATEALRFGAYDYITKPFDHEIILNRLDKVLLKRNLTKEIHFHRTKETESNGSPRIISKSQHMAAVFELIKKVSATASNVLITGESGTGKELIARAVHHESPRADNPFVAINCAAIPAELMESEFFGYEKGAFTGAYRQTIGKFEFAHQGTLFLDEISSLKPEFQAKLLRFIQEREFSRVGSHRSIKVDVRLVAATNTRLDGMVKAGTFRDDLFFRLNVVPVDLPPLRRRKGDIPLLSGYFMSRFNQQMHKRVNGFTPNALAVLEAYPWPGNVRELENLIERLVVLGTDHKPVDEKDLPLDLIFHTESEKGMAQSAWETKGLLQARATFERLYILKALKTCDWNQTRTAKLLDIHRNTLLQKMKNLDLGLGKRRRSQLKP